MKPASDDELRPVYALVGADRFLRQAALDRILQGDLVGRIALRLTVFDRGGHRVTSERRTLEIARIASLPEQVPIPLRQDRSRGLHATRVSAPSMDEIAVRDGSIRANERASRMYREAMTHRERGEYAKGVASLREAIKLKPQWADAFSQMAGMLYHLGDLDRARDLIHGRRAGHDDGDSHGRRNEVGA